MGDLGAPVRNAAGFSGFLIFSEAFDAGAQGHQRVVDVSGFTQPASGISGSVETNDKIIANYLMTLTDRSGQVV